MLGLRVASLEIAEERRPGMYVAPRRVREQCSLLGAVAIAPRRSLPLHLPDRGRLAFASHESALMYAGVTCGGEVVERSPANVSAETFRMPASTL